MSRMRSAVVDPSMPGCVAIHEIESPVAARNEALIRVAATSLNQGEVRYAQSMEANQPIGWDVAGIVETPAEDGSGPKAGARVVGLVRSGAWAELVAVPTNALATLPEDVTYEQAATLPVAGLTALYAIEKGNRLLGESVLITGANGGVGLFACQIAKLMDAWVVGMIRKQEYRDLITRVGADYVLLSEDGAAAKEFGPYKLVAESVGGQVLANCMTALSPDGICVTFGNSSQQETSFNVWNFMGQSRTSLYGFLLFNEFAFEPASHGLARLVELVSEDKLKTNITVEEPVDKIGEVAQHLMERKVPGKAVIRMWI